MARKQHEITFEEKADILKTYQDRTVKAHSIPKMYNITQKTMQDIVIEMGGDLRVPKKAKPRTKTANKVCPKCRKVVELKDAKFCPYCANDLRSENELLAERLENLKSMYAYIPETQRDTFMQTICETINVLNKGE